MLNTKLLGSVSAGPSEFVEDVFSTFLYTGNGSTQTITNGIALADGINLPIGTAIAGGYFAGFISTSGNSVATHALIVAPKATGENSSKQWKTAATSTSGTSSVIDGPTNSANMNNANHPAAQFCEDLTIGGFSDWYLPAKNELEVCYYNLKPTTSSNNTSGSGANTNAMPSRSSTYTAGVPAQTGASVFQSGGAQAFDAAAYWSSTETSSAEASPQSFSNGSQFNDGYKLNDYYVRAVRRVAISNSALDPYRVTGKGGLVWIKGRESTSDEHAIFDTIRGDNSVLSSQNTDIAQTETGFGSFLSNGFSLVSGGGFYNINQARNYCSWTFRKAPKFFDVVTWSGNSVGGREIAHNLGSTPGMIIAKRTDSTGDWYVYHRSLGGASNYLRLNVTNVVTSGTNIWFNTDPTSTVFTLGTVLNTTGGTYVAYIFAHDAGGFGAAGTDNVISCGSYTGNGSATGPVINLGYEPQYLLIKDADEATDWNLIDNMRGFVVGGTDAVLNPNLSNAESTGTFVTPTATGFQINTTNSAYNSTGAKHIYMAIRRPMKPPTSGTEVFLPTTYTGNGSTQTITTNFPVDFSLFINRTKSNFDNNNVFDRLRGGTRYLATNVTDAEGSLGSSVAPLYDSNTGVNLQAATITNGSSASIIVENFRRATGFFDVVCYTGDGSSTQIPHNLGVIPELCISKRRAATSSWFIDRPLNTTAYNQGAFDSAAFYDNWLPSGMPATATTIRPPNSSSGQTMVMYLFATLAGVSKVGEYTGDGTDGRVINCGFTGGARFVLIKRIDGTGNWRIWDTARGIVSGNDPFLTLNTTTAESTNSDDIDPTSSGFIVNYNGLSAINESGWKYIFLAIA